MPDWAPDKRIFRRFWNILSDIIEQNGGRNITNFVYRQNILSMQLFDAGQIAGGELGRRRSRKRGGAGSGKSRAHVVGFEDNAHC